MYIAVTSVTPLRIYVYDEGLVKLTGIVNKDTKNTNTKDETNGKLTLSQLLDTFKDTYGSSNTSLMMSKIKVPYLPKRCKLIQVFLGYHHKVYACK
jgi:hypothetical protein